mgnify:CR=1 FL=1
MPQDFTEGSVGKKLMLFALPIVLGMSMHTAYNIIDTIFIGMLGPLELAAVSLTFPLVFVFIAIASGLGVGANALIAQAVGEKNIHKANNLAEHALILSGILGVAIAALALFFAPTLFVAMGADEQVLPLALQYANIVFIGFIFMFGWFISDSILKSQGNSKTPMINLTISLIVNIILDPILIFGFGPIPAMGLVGAAVATVFSRLIALVLNFMYIYTPKSTISLALKEFKPNAECIKQMVVVGLPASASQSLTAIGYMLLMGFVGGFGSYAIAAYGIGMRLNSIAIMPIVGMSMAVTSFVGQNVGAGNFDRARKVSLLAVRITIVISLVIMAALMLFPEAVMRIFTQHFLVIGIGKQYLSIVPVIFPLYAFYFVIIGAFMGAGKTQLAFVTNLAYWIITVIIAFFLSQSMGLRGIWIALIAGAMVEMVLVAAIFYSGQWLKGIKN